MSDVPEDHRKESKAHCGVAVVTVSTSRTIDNDRSGDIMESRVTGAGHVVTDRRIVTDEAGAIRRAARELLARGDTDAVIFSGGTGLSPTDVTVETIAPLFTKPLSAFSALFTQLSYEQVGAAAMLSRATAGLVEKKVVFCLPGNPNAVELALDRIILPELGHLLGQARRER